MKYFNTLVKLIVLTLFLIVTNTEAKIFYRIDLLHHYYEGITGIVIYLSIWLITIISMLEIAFLKSFRLRLVFSSLVIVSAMSGFMYELIAQTQIDYDSLAVMWEARQHTDDAALFYANKLLIMLPVLILTYYAFLSKPYYHLDLSKILGHTVEGIHKSTRYLSILSPFIVVFAIAVMRGGYGTEGLPNQSKVLSLWSMLVISDLVADENLSRNKVSIELNEKVYQSKPNIVLIVDESVSGDFINVDDISLVPALNNNRDAIVDFGNATSATNCSSGSNYILRTGGDPKDIDTSTSNNPFIWDYAKQAGYKTVYIEAQAEEGRYNNRMTLNEKSYIDEFVYALAETRYERDIRSTDILKEKLLKSDSNFIYIVKSGIHFPYESSYPEDNAKFSPHMSGGHFINDATMVINSYKNAIAWTINNYFEALFEDIDLSNSIIIYTSDHGQNLLDNGNQLTHCSKNNTSPYEGLVPLLVITENKEYQAEFEKMALLNKNNSSHFNIFPTILTMLGYDADKVVELHGPTLASKDLEDHQFISGIVSSYRISVSDRNVIKWNDIVKEILSGQIGRDNNR